MSQIPAVDDSIVIGKMLEDKALGDRLANRVNQAFLAAGAAQDAALGWRVDRVDLIYGDPALIEAWKASAMAERIGASMPIPDKVIDAAVAAIATKLPFPKPAPTEPAEAAQAPAAS